MNKVLEETLAPEKADPTFEQRMLSAFRSKVPRRSSIGAFLVNVMRLRAAQITAAAAMLLALVQVGRTVTGERGAGSRNRAYFATNKVVAQPAQAPPTFFDTLDASHKSDDRRNKENDRLAAGESLAREQTSAAPAKAKDEKQKSAEVERTIITGSNIPTAAEVGPTPSSVPTGAANRKLIRNAQVELEIVSFDDAVQKITSFASEERGYVATSTSEKQANGKLKGEVVIKIIPENLDGFLKKIRGLGELKNQTLGTEDVTKASSVLTWLCPKRHARIPQEAPAITRSAITLRITAFLTGEPFFFGAASTSVIFPAPLGCGDSAMGLSVLVSTFNSSDQQSGKATRVLLNNVSLPKLSRAQVIRHQ